MSVSLGKIPGVESAEVRLNQGRAVLRLRPENAVSLDQVRQVIEKNGFTPRDATVTLRADVVLTGNRRQIRVPGPNVTYDVAGSTAGTVQDEINKAAGQTMIVEGVIPAPKGKAATQVIEVKAIKPASKPF